MTLPYERTRAVISVREFLFRLSSPYVENGIKGIRKEVRNEALRLLRHYPGNYDLHQAAKSCPNVFDVNETTYGDDDDA